MKRHPSQHFRVVCWHPKIGLWPWFGYRADWNTAVLSARLTFEAVHGFLPTSMGNVRKEIGGYWVTLFN